MTNPMQHPALRVIDGHSWGVVIPVAGCILLTGWVWNEVVSRDKKIVVDPATEWILLHMETFVGTRVERITLRFPDQQPLLRMPAFLFAEGGALLVPPVHISGGETLEVLHDENVRFVGLQKGFVT